MRTGGRGHGGIGATRKIFAAACVLTCLITGEVCAQSGQRVDDAGGYHPGVGVEYPLGVRRSLPGGGRDLFLSPDAAGAAGAGGRIDGPRDLDTWMFTGGLQLVY